MNTVAFHSLGCKVNSYETDIMQQKFTENGFRVVPFTQKADVYVINTCTVTNIADRKSRQMLHRAKTLNPDAIVIATGCYVQTDTEGVLKDASVDIAIGNNEKTRILEILNEYVSKQKKTSSILDIMHTSEYESMMLTETAERTRALLRFRMAATSFVHIALFLLPEVP